MEKTDWKENRYGLIGKDISYSFSRGYFAEKFKMLRLHDHSYENFDLFDISEFKELLSKPNIKGFNVTIPYKQEIIPYLDSIDKEAGIIGAVNTIKFTENGTIGYNTDCYGFKKSLEPLLKPQHNNALILGTGGASKAVFHVLQQLGIKATYVSRRTIESGYSYDELTPKIIKNNYLIVNCTPLGTHPNIEAKPPLPYQHLSPNHLLYDLIYNPSKSAFLREGEKKDCAIKNGLEMLEQQAEKSWEIWRS
jgi:shikimate dehydrogenase